MNTSEVQHFVNSLRSTFSTLEVYAHLMFLALAIVVFLPFFGQC